ncbi:tyrosine-protein phosphatase [Saccharopolyspora rosea]|uniref:Tyrosine-protein phosphatase n=1 Tax=Saccharopolyspora rosea TaxID=524884 RepID=A0ABW3FTJ1_9PSEU|nr:tyrosine-protein phosphatase [Saccharopolyspora rosea]
MDERALHWEGCLNARDLGGLATGRVRWGAVARSDDPAHLTAAGPRDDTPRIRQLLAERGATERAVIRRTVGSLDVADHLRAGGLTGGEATALRRRLT